MEVAVGQCPDNTRALAGLLIEERILPEDVVLPQYAHHRHVVVQDLHTPPRDKMQTRKNITLVDESISRRSVGRPKPGGLL